MKWLTKGNVVVTITALIPALLWVIFTNRTVLSLDTAGRISGLIALSLLSINIILSGRFRLFDRLFNGLDQMYRSHQLIGGFTLILALLHANFLLLSATNLSIQAGYNLLTDLSSVPLIAGKISLFMLASAMIVVLYFTVKYQWFISLQRLMGAVIFIAGYHALFVAGSDVKAIKPLFVYMVSLGAIASGIYIYRSLFHKPLNRLYKYEVVSTKSKGVITEIFLKPLSDRLQHYAGQFVFVSFNSNFVSSETHPFSISSGSDSAIMRISAKNLGDYTRTLTELSPGDIAHLEGPFGNFSFSKITHKNQTWIAGGIGVTPFLSMAQSLPSDIQVTLFYSVKKPEDAVYLSELKQIAKNKKNFTVFPIYTEKTGYLNVNTVIKHVQSLESVLLCGPRNMMKGLKKELIKHGISKHNIHYEEFSLS